LFSCDISQLNKNLYDLRANYAQKTTTKSVVKTYRNLQDQLDRSREK